MRARVKLVFMALAAVALAYSAHEVVIHLRPKPPSPRQIGLEWLRQEYNIPDEAYQKIALLHQEYFVRCDEMCATMERTHRPLLHRKGVAMTQEMRARALRHEKAVCENCLDNMVLHLTKVAALMPPLEGERFLKDILPEVINPPELQKLRSQVNPSQ
jgi:hypothetical protein